MRCARQESGAAGARARIGRRSDVEEIESRVVDGGLYKLALRGGVGELVPPELRSATRG
jgi:hypothetical protein